MHAQSEGVVALHSNQTAIHLVSVEALCRCRRHWKPSKGAMELPDRR